MMPSCDQTGVPGDEALTHFTSSTTWGSAFLMSLRILRRVSPRQSPRSAIRFEMSADADWLWLVSDLFMVSSSRFIPSGSSSSSYASRLRPVGRPTGVHPELLRILGIQSLPAAELHGVGAHDAPDRLTRQVPLEYVEADVPARRTPRDEAAIDVVPQRESGSVAEWLELPAKIVASPVVLEQPRRLGPRHGGLGDLRRRRTDRRELHRPYGRQIPVGVGRRPFPGGDRVGQGLPDPRRRGRKVAGPNERPTGSVLPDFRACGGAWRVALTIHHRFLPFGRALRFLRFDAGCRSIRSR